jgi:hypothetical protein
MARRPFTRRGTRRVTRSKRASHPGFLGVRAATPGDLALTSGVRVATPGNRRRTSGIRAQMPRVERGGERGIRKDTRKTCEDVWLACIRPRRQRADARQPRVALCDVRVSSAPLRVRMPRGAREEVGHRCILAREPRADARLLHGLGCERRRTGQRWTQASAKTQRVWPTTVRRRPNSARQRPKKLPATATRAVASSRSSTCRPS